MTEVRASTQRRKLIEVSLPLEAINRASAREKSIRHGHPSTLHLWWARRPLAACRAVLFAQLVDDPSSRPEEFPTEDDQARERKRLHGIIEEMVPWEATNDERILNKARYEIARSLARGRGEAPPPRNRPDEVLAWLAEHAPPVCDPFCGGGSSRWKRSASACGRTARTSTRSRCWFPRRPARSRPNSPVGRRSTRTAIRMSRGRAPRVWPRISAITASGCATRPNPGSATSTRRSGSPKRWRRRGPISSPMPART